MVTKKETLRLIPSYLRKPCVSNLFMAKGHTHYVLVRGSHVEKKTVSGILNRLNYGVVFIVYT